jgi:hypothetical protein
MLTGIETPKLINGPVILRGIDPGAYPLFSSPSLDSVWIRIDIKPCLSIKDLVAIAVLRSLSAPVFMR